MSLHIFHCVFYRKQVLKDSKIPFALQKIGSGLPLCIWDAARKHQARTKLKALSRAYKPVVLGLPGAGAAYGLWQGNRALRPCWNDRPRWDTKRYLFETLSKTKSLYVAGTTARLLFLSMSGKLGVQGQGS